MKKIEFQKLLSEKILILDGAMGTELQKRGYLEGIGAPEELNITAPEKLEEIHKDYLDAGAEIIISNTFGGNRHKLKDYNLESKLEALNTAGIEIARNTAKKYNALVGGDIGPIGTYLSPLGSVSFDEAYDIFSEQAKALAKANPDFLIIETMAEIREIKAALLAAKDNFSGPVIVQMTFTADGSTVTGTGLLAFLSVAESMGADVLGMNCSVGPKDLAKFAKILAQKTVMPISFKPNAGMPKLINRQTVFPGTPEEFTAACEDAYKYGVNMIGGCCGTNPDYIRHIAKALKNRPPAKRNLKIETLISSRNKAYAVTSSENIISIGERINPTNRKKFQEELLEGNFATLRNEAREQVKSGADILDINLGLPGADEKKLMIRAVEEIQETVTVPLCLDSSSVEVLEAGIRACAGKPVINSVNGEDKRLEQILPLVKRYGAMIIGLTIDDNGIPEDSETRLKIADKIISKCQEYGIAQSEIILDFLTLSASAMENQIKETLTAIKESKKRWPLVKTVLGVSNVSFGMPDRHCLNSTFLKLAKQNGLDMAILNPHENWTVYDKSAESFLMGLDAGGKNYINQKSTTPKKISAQAPVNTNISDHDKLFKAILDGDRERIPALAKVLMPKIESGEIPAFEIIDNCILKALNEVGEKFRNKEYFLPQVMRSSETVQEFFGYIRPLLKNDSSLKSQKIVLATVKGDVHDIGKNIVAAVMESHGWEVIDLGKNVESDTIINIAQKNDAQLIGLSALMTTTMLEMEKVVLLRNSSGLKTKILIGGAPVTESFAKEIGADAYAKDAVAAAEIAKSLLQIN